MEIWDCYDINRQLTGGELVRGEALPEGCFHTVIHVCVFNSRGEMLIQQRQPFKKGWPNLWDVSCGGSILKGETSQMGAHRELLEELGMDYDFNGIRPDFTYNFYGGFDDFYLIEKEVEIDTLKFQYEEVQGAKWASREEILEMIDKGLFIPYFKSIIGMVFEVRGQHDGCIKINHNKE